MNSTNREVAPEFPLPASLMDGHHFSTVYVGNSMYPTFQGPDLLYVRRCKAIHLSVGDVIVFYQPGGNIMVTHRVVAAGAGKVRTRGDNNFLPDPWALADDDILGKVVYYQRGRKLVKVRSGLPGLVVTNARRSILLARSVILRGLIYARSRIALIAGRR